MGNPAASFWLVSALFWSLAADAEMIRPAKVQRLQAGPDRVQQMAGGQGRAPGGDSYRSLLIFAADARKIETGLQFGDLRKGNQPAILRERGAGETFQSLGGVRSGPEHDRNEIVAFAIDRDRGAAEIGIQQLRDLFRRYSELSGPILIDLDDDLDDLVAPIVIIVADAGSGLKQRSHAFAERKQTVGIGA